MTSETVFYAFAHWSKYSRTIEAVTSKLPSQPTMPIQQTRDIIQMNGLISDEPIQILLRYATRNAQPALLLNLTEKHEQMYRVLFNDHQTKAFKLMHWGFPNTALHVQQSETVEVIWASSPLFQCRLKELIPPSGWHNPSMHIGCLQAQADSTLSPP